MNAQRLKAHDVAPEGMKLIRAVDAYLRQSALGLQLTDLVKMREAGYRVLAAWREATPVALAGYRIEENLIYRRVHRPRRNEPRAGRRRPRLRSGTKLDRARIAGHARQPRLKDDAVADQSMSRPVASKKG